MKFFLMLVLTGLLMGTGLLLATETTSPSLQRERQTSVLSEISLKPLFLFSARGRRDPFVFDLSLDTSSQAASRDFSISELTLVGFIGSGDLREALFISTWQDTTFKFRGGHLYNPEGALIATVAGSFDGQEHVSLTQGDSNIVFSMPENPRFSSLNAERDHHRKEQQP